MRDTWKRAWWWMESRKMQARTEGRAKRNNRQNDAGTTKLECQSGKNSQSNGQGSRVRKDGWQLRRFMNQTKYVHLEKGVWKMNADKKKRKKEKNKNKGRNEKDTSQSSITRRNSDCAQLTNRRVLISRNRPASKEASWTVEEVFSAQTFSDRMKRFQICQVCSRRRPSSSQFSTTR
jgi:hypothetical protein